MACTEGNYREGHNIGERGVRVCMSYKVELQGMGKSCFVSRGSSHSIIATEERIEQDLLEVLLAIHQKDL